MKTQTPGWLVTLGAVACSFSSCTQPATECQVGLAGFSSFATVYISKGPPSPAGCETMNPRVVQMGDLIGMEYYHPVSSDGTTYNDNVATVAIKSDTIGQEYGQYYGGCVPAVCASQLPCTQDSDCTPHIEMDGGLDSTVVGSCNTTSGLCTTTTCVTDADCAGAPCVNGSCEVACGPVADGCGGLAVSTVVCMVDADCGGTGSCAPSAMGGVQKFCTGTCGACPTGQTCGGGGTPGICGSGTPCVPMSCSDLGATCGPAGDGCGGVLMCGTCPQSPSTCKADSDCADAGPCVCSDGSASPCTAANVGTCSNPQTCGGNGIPSVCGHPFADPKATDTLWATGTFAQHYPDSNDLCQIVNVAPAAQTFSSGPTTTVLPTDTLGYTWSNVNVYVTAADQGTQFDADLTYTENGCTASYHAIGVWPGVDCTVPVIDPTDPRGLNVIGVTPYPDACNPCEQPNITPPRFVGSGISPDYHTVCQQIFPTTCTNGNCVSADPFGRDPYYCVLANDSDPPQILPTPISCSD